jgi:flagellar biosynthesis/type III secretory pathway protein FliH
MPRLTLGLNRAKIKLISGFIDRYLDLTSKEQREFDESVKGLGIEETEGVMEIVTSWMKEGLRQGRQEGRQEGRQQGQIEAARDAVIEILEARFKKIPAGLKRTLKALDDRKQLKLLLRQAATVATLKDFERRLPRPS